MKIKKQGKKLELENRVPCQLSGFRTQLIEELRRGYLSEIKVGNVGSTSAKKRTETVNYRGSYEAPKMVR